MFSALVAVGMLLISGVIIGGHKLYVEITCDHEVAEVISCEKNGYCRSKLDDGTEMQSYLPKVGDTLCP